MKVLVYNEIDTHGVDKQYKKILEFLAKNDFKSAEVKKMRPTNFYRAKLDDKNRLLFQIARYENESYILVLEVIHQHAYDKSRFLNGAVVDEAKFEPIQNDKQLIENETAKISFLNPNSSKFHILDKILSFDDDQNAVFNIQPPLILIGSAGSGKTALTLEKLKSMPGKVLYITLSPYLVENSRNLYYNNNYANDSQEIDFLSFHEYLQTISIPKGKEVVFRDFDFWISRYKQAFKIRDSYKVFEEFKGVITGNSIDRAYLSKADYLKLGIKQSVFSQEEREKLYDLFSKYLEWLNEGNYYDSNLTSFALLSKIKPIYDFVVVDEVQDFTNIQLFAILKSLVHEKNFLLCGDSNQIVHPNFFSWSNIKTMFYKQELKGDLTRILTTNYRNTPEVTQIANQLLLVKNARFGSIDKESTYLVKTASANKGEVQFFEDNSKIKKDLNANTKLSTNFAVLVMRNEDKPAARQFFDTPLLFSVQEAKGLEYENIILYNFISTNKDEFRELTNGVSKEELTKEEIDFSRAKNKSDKSLEIYKFYVNSLYVAITRAVKNLYFIESQKSHDLLKLLNLVDFKEKVAIKEQASSMDDWQKEARKLEKQGKQEQADEIRKSILHIQEVPWEVYDYDKLTILAADALDPERFNKKSKDLLFQYALVYNEPYYFKKLLNLNYKAAQNYKTEMPNVWRRILNNYSMDNIKDIQTTTSKYGVDYRNEHNQTPLMLATIKGSTKIIDYLLDIGAKKENVDNYGRNAFHIALQNASLDKKYATTILPKVYNLLQPDAIKVKIGNNMVKFHNKQMEFFMLSFMIANMREMIFRKVPEGYCGFETADFMTASELFPEHIMAEYRKKRPYISSFLSKHEIKSTNAYCKQLFMRTYQGVYMLNPILEIEIDGVFYNYYEKLLHLSSFNGYKGFDSLVNHIVTNAERLNELV